MFYKFDFSVEKYGELCDSETGDLLEDGETVVCETHSRWGWGSGEMNEDEEPDEGANIVNWYKESTFEEMYYWCECCEQYKLEDVLHTIHDSGEVVCEDCLGDYYYCDCCNEYFADSGYGISDNDRYICEHCADWNGYHVCDDCGCISNDGSYDESDDYWYCHSCYDRNCSTHDYGYKPMPYFHRTSSENRSGRLLYLGVELEVDDGDNKRCVSSEYSEDDVYCKHDGSLGEYGFEIVSHPRTLNSHKQWEWRSVMQTCRNNSYTSHDAGTCGLHIHVNRDFFDDDESAAAKIIILLDRFWDTFFVPFSRRTSYQLRDWANRPREEEVVKALDDDDVRRWKMSCAKSGRYKALNLTNENTIEFRLFRGTLKYSTFMATLELVDGICRYANGTTLEKIVTAPIDEIIMSSGYFDNTEYLLDYIVERGITLNDEVPNEANNDVSYDCA